MVRRDKLDPRIRDLAANIVLENVSGKNFYAEIQAIFDWIRDNIRFVNDIVDVETLQGANQTLDCGFGDCDDHAILMCALLESIGHPTRFMAVGFSPDSLVHVYAQTKCGKNWISCDTTEPYPLSWEPPGIRNRLIIYNGSTK